MKQVLQRVKLEIYVEREKNLDEAELIAMALDCPSASAIHELALNCMGGYKSLVQRGIRVSVDVC